MLGEAHLSEVSASAKLLLRCCVQAMFAQPLPEFSNRMVALATQLTSQWLMGPSEVTTEERPDGTVVSGTTVKVCKRRSGVYARLLGLQTVPCGICNVQLEGR
jgi:hypothetical protein